MRNAPPRDGIAPAHVWVPIDATDGQFYSTGSRFGTQAGVLVEVHKETGQPHPTRESTGFFDPRCLRWHDLQRETPAGVADRRLSVQVVNDFDAE